MTVVWMKSFIVKNVCEPHCHNYASNKQGNVMKMLITLLQQYKYLSLNLNNCL